MRRVAMPLLGLMAIVASYSGRSCAQDADQTEKLKRLYAAFMKNQEAFDFYDCRIELEEGTCTGGIPKNGKPGNINIGQTHKLRHLVDGTKAYHELKREIDGRKNTYGTTTYFQDRTNLLEASRFGDQIAIADRHDGPLHIEYKPFHAMMPGFEKAMPRAISGFEKDGREYSWRIVDTDESHPDLTLWEIVSKSESEGTRTIRIFFDIKRGHIPVQYEMTQTGGFSNEKARIVVDKNNVPKRLEAKKQRRTDKLIEARVVDIKEFNGRFFPIRTIRTSQGSLLGAAPEARLYTEWAVKELILVKPKDFEIPEVTAPRGTVVGYHTKKSSSREATLILDEKVNWDLIPRLVEIAIRPDGKP